MENLSETKIDFPVLKICAYPFPADMVKEIVNRCGEILILEEGYPLIEEGIRGILDSGIKVLGRLDGTVPVMASSIHQ